MRVVLQRVTRASVAVAGRVTGAIDGGYALLVGFAPTDSDETVAWMANKILSLRLFADAEGKMNRDLAETDGGILVVSQFTLYGDTRKGRRPSFVDAAPPERAERLYDAFVDALIAAGGRVATGEFGAAMVVELANAGPVTLILER